MNQHLYLNSETANERWRRQEQERAAAAEQAQRERERRAGHSRAEAAALVRAAAASYDAALAAAERRAAADEAAAAAEAAEDARVEAERQARIDAELAPRRAELRAEHLLHGGTAARFDALWASDLRDLEAGRLHEARVQATQESLQRQVAARYRYGPLVPPPAARHRMQELGPVASTFTDAAP